jgi:hypothetical protein
MTSVLDFLRPKSIDNPDELVSALESLPLYENLTQNTDEPAIFDDEQEPLTGLISFIRKNSDLEETIDDSTNIVRLKKNDFDIVFIVIYRWEQMIQQFQI